MNPSVSIIIRTLNEAKYIKPLLKSIKGQSYEDLEIILVDSGSFDNTVEIASEYCDKILHIKQEEFTFGFSINHGIQKAEGELIGIISAHTLPLNVDWLKHLVNGFHMNGVTGKVAMTYGKQLGKEESNSAEKNDFNRHFGDTKKIQVRPNYFCNNANSMIRKDLWDKHPFDESLSGLEDIEWSKYWMDRGYVVIYEPRAAIYHIHRETSDQIQRRFWRESVAAKSIGAYNNLNLLNNILAEPIYFIGDVLSANSRKKENTTKEIFNYRYNKVLGIFKSLPSKKIDLEDYSLYYAPFEYKTVEISKRNDAHLASRSLNPTRPNEVLVKVAFVGVCETDLEVLKGELEYYKSGWARYPIIPGHEFSGIVLRKGAKVNNVEIGDKVVGQCIMSCGICKKCLSRNETACDNRQEVGVLNFNGAYAEYINIPSRFVNKLNDNITLKTASSIEPLAVVLKGLKRISLQSESLGHKENVLVIGGGPIGHLSSRICHHYGHSVSIVEKNKIRAKMFEDININIYDVLPPFDDYSVIIESTGIQTIAEQVVNEASNGVRILLFGFPYGYTSINLESVVNSDKIIVGSVGSSSDDFRRAIDLIPNLNMENFNNCVFDFESWEKAWEKHKTKSELKVKLKVSSDLEVE